MANKPLKTIKFPGLDDTYTIPQVDAALATSGAAADAKKVGDELTNLKQDLTQLSDEMPNKANVDGSYDNMTVGNAKQLVATVGITDKTPYNFRTSGGSVDIGDREVDKVVGGTVAWNQYCTDPTFTDESKWYHSGTMAVTMSNNVAECIASAKYAVLQNLGVRSAGTLNGHVVVVLCDLKADESYSIEVLFGDNVLFTDNFTKSIGTSWATYGCFSKHNAVTMTSVYAGIRDASDSGWKKVYVRNFCVFDLTQMFGTTIADYIYGLEQSQAGAGVAWFKKLFPKPYYAYDAGSLQSVQTSEHKMVGFNQWDEVWEVGKLDPADGRPISSSENIRSKNFIPVLPNTTYFWRASVNNVFIFYDAEKNYIINGYNNGNTTFQTPTECRYIKFYVAATYGNTYKNDICINLSWDGERNGEYEPYVEYTYPLDDSLTLRGIPKLDSGNNLYYYGDVYEADGTVTRKYGIVDLGTLTWTYVSVTGHIRFFGNIPSADRYARTATINCVCPKYETQAYADVFNNNKTGIAIHTDGTQIAIYDPNYTDVATFGTAMSGVYLVYELATPTTETAEPFTNPQIVDDFGTEEYVDAGVTASTPTRDVAIPVGHETVYQANLRAKLEMAPNSPDGDGDYIVRQTNGENEYVLLEEELPSAPSSDGTYVLKATVASGTATLTWVEET